MISTDNICKGSLLRNITFESDDSILCVLSDRPQDIRCLFSLLSKAKEPDSGSLKLPGGIIPYLPGPHSFPKNLTVSDCLKLAAAAIKVRDYPDITKELISDISRLRFSSLTPFSALKASAAILLTASPEYILLEDPIKELPPSEHGSFADLVRKISEHSKLIFSCSLPSVFEEISDSLLVLSNGRLLEYGSTAAVLKKANSLGTLILRVKGDPEKISEITKLFGSDETSVENTERKGVFKLTIPETDDHKRIREIKKAVSGAGMVLLDIRSDNASLKKLFQAMNDRENELASEYSEEDGQYVPVDENILAFNHDSDDSCDDYDDDDDTAVERTDSASDTQDEPAETEPDIRSLLSHPDNPDDPDDYDDLSESTLFSSSPKNSNTKKK